MSVKPVTQNLEANNSANKLKKQVVLPSEQAALNAAARNLSGHDKVSFTGGNPVVGLMDFIHSGGYAASFIIQDGCGFIAPRVGKGLVRNGEEKRDENGNVILDKNGQPQHKLNWAFARKEFLREVITGPSAFVIPLVGLHYIKKKFGTANDVKLGYIDSFKAPYMDFVKRNAKVVQAGVAGDHRAEFYKGVFADVIENSVNEKLSAGEKMTKEEVSGLAEKFANNQVEIEKIMSDKNLNKTARAEKIRNLGGTVETAFMDLKKSKIGGTVDEMAVEMTASVKDGKNYGSIDEMLKALKNYFDDAAKTTEKYIKNNITNANIEKSVKDFTRHKMGTRLLTNAGLFATVALFYTQIPKMYNIGLKGNPALKKEQAAGKTDNAGTGSKPQNTNGKDKVAFTGIGSQAGKVSEWVYKHDVSRYLSNMFELDGPVISGGAMAALLYGFCIPPRLFNAQDKYDFGEILLRDLTAFTTLLFGAKAVSRLSTDLFAKLTGLALNKKNIAGKNIFQKILAYVKPSDTGHNVLTTQQLTSKYTNIDRYKGGVSGFMDFIEKSGGNVKKAFAKDKNIKSAVDAILKNYNGKTYAQASASEIKDALKAAHAENSDLIKNFYKLFKDSNGMLELAKTCNSAFGFLSTIVLTPLIIIKLTNACEKMTEARTNKDKAESQPKVSDEHPKRVIAAANPPSMAGFLGKSVKAN